VSLANKFAADKNAKSACADYESSARRGTLCISEARFQPPP